MRSARSASGEIKPREIGGDETAMRKMQVPGGAAMKSGIAYRCDIKQPVFASQHRYVFQNADSMSSIILRMRLVRHFPTMQTAFLAAQAKVK